MKLLNDMFKTLEEVAGHTEGTKSCLKVCAKLLTLYVLSAMGSGEMLVHVFACMTAARCMMAAACTSAMQHIRSASEYGHDLFMIAFYGGLSVSI